MQIPHCFRDDNACLGVGKWAGWRFFDYARNNAPWQGGDSVGTVAGRRPAAEAIVDWLASLESSFDCVPVLNAGFAQAPAKQHYLVIETAGEIEKTRIEVLYLDTYFIDFSNGFADALHVAFLLGALFEYRRGVDLHATGEIDAPGKFGKIRLDLLRRLFALDGALQQRFQQREHGLSFVDGKGLHCGTTEYQFTSLRVCKLTRKNENRLISIPNSLTRKLVNL
jgi:hypothetical protein